MKRFTDLYIERPVLACVVSLLIFLFGLRAMDSLTLRQFPQVENTVITITTAYPGADAKLIQGFITTPIEKSVASANGVDYITSDSDQGISTIKAYIRLNADPNQAFTEIMSKVAQVKNILPREAQDPVISKDTGSQVALMYVSFNSDQMSAMQITDYISRVVQPEIETIPGVAEAQILGGKTFAMRIWLNPKQMAALNVTASDVSNALLNNNFQSAAGSTKAQLIAYSINAQTNLTTEKEFGNIVVRETNNSLIRLKDIATISLGSEDYESNVTFNGKQAIFIGIQGTPESNPLTVINQVRATLPEIAKSFPPSLHVKIVYDATKYISSSIHEVITTILEATIIVILVIFLFLGSLRSVIIPVVTIPLSLVGVCTFMLFMGYSINLLTLLAMVLAIGMVVDDAIVVVENIHRHIEHGESPLQAALHGAREIALPVIAMSITLAAVYLPIGFTSGLTGALFKEFAFTLAGTVIISGVVALTLSPMLCAKLLNKEQNNGKFVQYIDQKFDRLRVFYQARLHNTLDNRSVIVVLCVVVFFSIVFLYTHTQKELAPEEDQSVLFMGGTAPEYANSDYVKAFTSQLNPLFKKISAMQDYFVINGMQGVNSFFAGMILKPWDERKESQKQVSAAIQKQINSIAGVQVGVFPLPSLPTGSNGLPVQFVITTTGSYSLLYQITEKLLARAQQSGRFLFVQSTLQFDKPELNLTINRDKAGDLGINMQDIGNSLATLLGGNYLNYFSLEGRSYKVIPQLARQYRLNPQQLNQVYITTQNKQLIPLSTLIKLNFTVQPNTLSHFQQLNSATIQGLPMLGLSMGDVLEWLQQQAQEILPKGMTYNFAGESRSYVTEGNTLVSAFIFAIIVIFLVLSAQFESFRDPLIILISVPMSICGALIPLNLGLASINIYTQVGLITLIGLICKHGILMVQFANELQRDEGLSIRDAIEKAASIRLRPILMTTAAMILGGLPLLLAKGAGAVSRFDIGLVISTGMLIGTLFTLFVVPTVYTFLANRHVVEKG
ncbi:MAG: efflux RND transporter permease subunit [Legionellales bacterium]|nr:efflux RND transporter permease subunit [Legionellales bacterium]